MTNDELNRRVAVARGWIFTDEDLDWGLKPLTPTIRTPAGFRVPAVPNYADDPAAWGALYQQLAEESMQITLIFIRRPKPLLEWGATIWRGHKMWEASADSPGKALALAFVASQEGR